MLAPSKVQASHSVQSHLLEDIWDRLHWNDLQLENKAGLKTNEPNQTNWVVMIWFPPISMKVDSSISN